jgi:DNA replication protein DnaC
MINSSTLTHLRALKLNALAEGLELQAGQPEALTLSFEERLALLVDREVHSRQDRKRTRLLQKAQLKYPDASIEAADFTGISGLDRRALTALALSSWIERGDTVLLSGATGVGKTWAACALAQHACRGGHSALHLRVPRLPEDLRVLTASGALGKWLLQLARVEVLLLDDWGVGPLDSATRSALLEIVDDRASRRATIITHQLPLEHWHGWIGDATIADAILDRLLQRVHRFKLEGHSRRTGAAQTAARKVTPASAAAAASPGHTP